jgi:hypothetical protein
MPPIISGHLRAGKIWIDDALGGAARCRRVALRQGRVAAFVIAAPPAVHMQANRIRRIVRLGSSRRRRRNHRDRQNYQSRNAHQSLLRDMRGAAHRSRSHCIFRSGLAGFSDRQQTGRFVPSQFTFARWGRPSVAELARGSAYAAKFPLAWPSFRLMPSYYRRLYLFCVE